MLPSDCLSPFAYGKINLQDFQLVEAFTAKKTITMYWFTCFISSLKDELYMLNKNLPNETLKDNVLSFFVLDSTSPCKIKEWYVSNDTSIEKATENDEVFKRTLQANRTDALTYPLVFNTQNTS